MTTSTSPRRKRFIIAGLAAFGSVAGLTFAGYAAELTASEWASWVQAIGAIIAIAGAFLIAAWQNREARADDQALRHQEVLDAHNAVLEARALAVRNTVQVATFALDNALVLIQLLKERKPAFETEPHTARIDHLRTVLDSLINSTTEHLAVVSALGISQILTQVHAHTSKANGMPLAFDVLPKCEKRVREGYDSLGRLIDLQLKLDGMCRARGIPIELNEYPPAI